MAETVAEEATTAQAPPKRPIGEIINEFVELRDFLGEKRKEYKTLETQMKADMDILSAQILDAQRALGLTSLSTDNYTAFQTTKKSVRMGDWDKFIKYVTESHNFQMLEKRCAKLACLEVFDDGVEPYDVGLEFSAEIEVQVRKK